tara:strand:- start:372 stop:557 length:186 start_codon:yes stop_codon:yes gene_type:complete
MSEQDLEKFIQKVEQLKAMVESFKSAPERSHQLSKCTSHDEVVKLAKSWGYEIGKRWGEQD